MFTRPTTALNLAVSDVFPRIWNTNNGLLRHSFPKGINFKIVKIEEVKKAVNLVNNRPQKILTIKLPIRYSMIYNQVLYTLKLNRH
jgi:IS30 family transposase